MWRFLGFSVVTTGLSLLLLASTVGCGDSGSKPSPTPSGKPSAAEAQPDQHKHGDDHAQQELHTFAEGVAALQEHYEEIKAAFAQSDTEKAHEPLHHVGNLLEALPELGKTAGLSATDLEKLKQAVEQMFDAYGKVDDAIHQNKDADYPAVAEQLDQSMTAISALLASPPPAEK